MWHILFPALTARFLVKPLIKSKIKKGKSELMPEWTGHKVDLDQAEEEELLFLQNYDTQFIDFAGINVSHELELIVKKKAAGQKNYKRKHKVMDLEQFGITREMITRDFAFVFKEYGIDPNF